jgi:hypothetical protein
MPLQDWAKQALRGAAECDLEPVPAASSGGEESETICVTFSKKDLARCRRAAAFCKMPFEEWLRGSIISSMECDESDMVTERGAGVGRDIPTGRESSGWELRETLPDPLSFN